MNQVHQFISYCLENPYATQNYIDKTYTFEDVDIKIGIGIIKLNTPDADFYMVFSCPGEKSKNIFFAVSEDTFDTAALCVAYCEWYGYGHKAYIEEYIHFKQVFIPELEHLHGILLSTTKQSPVLNIYPEVITFDNKEYNTLFCIPCSAKDHDILSQLGFFGALDYFFEHGKDLTDFKNPLKYLNVSNYNKEVVATPTHTFIDFCRLNEYAAEDYWDFTYTINQLKINIGIIKLNMSDADFYMVFSCPSEKSKNVFFAVSKDTFDTAALCVAYCEWCGRDYKTYHADEYINFKQFFIPELEHLHGILFSITWQLPVLTTYPAVMTFDNKRYNTLFCIPCSSKDHEILSKLGFFDALDYFREHGKDLTDFDNL